MLALDLYAPFAAFRPMAAGWYRPTASMITPSAAYGLLLNIARIEMRLPEEDEEHSGRVPSSLARSDLPVVRLAIGVPASASLPRVQTAFQQLHNYPVGKDAGVPAEWTKGTKNNIAPVRREFLSDLRVIICVDGNQELEERVRLGLNGKLNEGRYGLPFVGANAFLIERLQPLAEAPPCRWYEPVTGKADCDRIPFTARLTVWIDRSDMTRTQSSLYAPTEELSAEIPEDAWTTIEPNSNGK